MNEQELKKLENAGAKEKLFHFLSSSTWEAHTILESICKERAKDFPTDIARVKKIISDAEQLYARWKS